MKNVCMYKTMGRSPVSIQSHPKWAPAKYVKNSFILILILSFSLSQELS